MKIRLFKLPPPAYGENKRNSFWNITLQFGVLQPNGSHYWNFETWYRGRWHFRVVLSPREKLPTLKLWQYELHNFVYNKRKRCIKKTPNSVWKFDKRDTREMDWACALRQRRPKIEYIYCTYLNNFFSFNRKFKILQLLLKLTVLVFQIYLHIHDIYRILSRSYNIYIYIILYALHFIV